MLDPRGSQEIVLIVIVIVNSIFLQRPQKQGRGNQLIHRRLSRIKSDGYGGWCLELRRGGIR